MYPPFSAGDVGAVTTPYNVGAPGAKEAMEVHGL